MGTRGRPVRTTTWDRFLEKLEDGASITEACEAIDVGRNTAYAHRDVDAAFAERWDAAIEKGTDALEKEAVRRAMDGSDPLMQFLLKGRRRQVYGEKLQLDAKVEAVTSAELAAARRAAADNPAAIAAFVESLAEGEDA